MIVMLPVVPVMLLLASTAATARTCTAPEPVAGHCIDLMADGIQAVSEVQVSPGQPTTFHFDSDVHMESVTLENREHFELAHGKRLLTLEPSEKLRDAPPSRVTLCFADDAAPSCATFRLTVHPAVGERRVEVLRHARSVASIQAELNHSREENLDLRAALQQLRAEMSGPGGLSGLLHSRFLDAAGIPCSWMNDVERPGNVLTATSVVTCHARGQMVVRVNLRNTGTRPWTPQGARLVGPKDATLDGSLWLPGAVLPGEAVPVYFEVQARGVRTLGPFTLKLWEADGGRLVTLDNVMFPVLAEPIKH